MSDEPVIQIVQELFDVAVAQGDARREGRTIPNGFVVRHGPYAVKVHYNAGSSKDVSLNATYDAVARADHPALLARSSAYRAGGGRPLASTRPLAIELRAEDGDHVAAKAKGLNIEWQSGDAAFDRAVYVDSPVTDPEVLAAVIGPDVRGAVRALLDMGFKTVSIDEDKQGTISAYLNEFSSREASPGRGAATLRAFAQILANLPAIATSGPTVQRRPLFGLSVFLSIIGLAGWAGSVFYVQGVLAASQALLHLSDSAVHLAWWEIAVAIALGIVAGIPALFVYGRLVAALARGTSRANKDVLFAQFATFGATSVVVFTATIVGIVAAHAK